LNQLVEPGAPNEWPSTLDLEALAAAGWQPTPFHEFVIKIHSRCDLACDYCYMYEMSDQSWRDQPLRMSVEIASRTADRIGEHTRAHGLTAVSLVLHGGEPLLAGRDLISHLAEKVRAAVDGIHVDLRVQTNGVGLSESYLRLFEELGVKIGVSIDGIAEAHDRHRRFPSGRGSFKAVAAGLHRLTEGRYRHLFSGLLCTIDLRNDPLATYQALADFDPPEIDFLLPHGTWANPPPGRIPGVPDAPYADWLIAIFEQWYRLPLTRIRLFDQIMRLLLGRGGSSEMIGLAPSRTLVIETDGSVEQADTLKAAYPGAPKTGLHVSRNSFDDAFKLPGIVARQLGVLALTRECRTCPVHQVCGAGLYAHRYRPGSGFANRSVYCPDLMALIEHIGQTVQNDLKRRG
jgi:uncharacterized protein